MDVKFGISEEKNKVVFFGVSRRVVQNFVKICFDRASPYIIIENRYIHLSIKLYPLEYNLIFLQVFMVNGPVVDRFDSK